MNGQISVLTNMQSMEVVAFTCPEKYTSTDLINVSDMAIRLTIQVDKWANTVHYIRFTFLEVNTE